MSGERERDRQAVEGVASDIATRAEPGVRAAIEKSARESGLLRSGERMTSETAHRYAAQQAREHDARSRR